MLRTTLNIIFPLVTFPYITRVLSPEGIGMIEFSRSISNYFILIAALGITQYAVREGAAIKGDKTKLVEFSNQMFTLNLFSASIAFVTLIIILLIPTNLNMYSHIIIIFSFQILFDAIAVEWLYTLEEDFIYITIRSFIFQVISMILMFVLVKSKEDYLLYVMITTFSLGGSYIFNFIHSKKYVKLRINTNFFQHLKPVCILFLNNIASTIYLNSDITILGLISSDYHVGIYSTGVKIYTIVKKMTNAVLMSMIPRLSFYYRNDNKDAYNYLVNEIFWSMIMLIIPSSVGLISLRNEIVSIIAGPRFMNSTNSLMILSIGLVFSVISAYFVYGVLLVQKKENKILKVTLISAVINILFNISLIPFFNEIGAAISTVFCEMFVVIYSYKICSKAIKIRFDLKRILSILAGSILVFAICTIFSNVFNNDMLSLITSIFLSVISYIGIIILTGTLPDYEYK